MANIHTRKGLETLLERYKKAGVTDEKYPIDKWITCIEQCIKEGMAMDEIDYENTPANLKPLWRGLK